MTAAPDLAPNLTPQATPASTPTHVISVLALDRPGIIAAITSVLADHHANILELSQTVVRAHFTVIAAMQLEPAGPDGPPADADALCNAVMKSVGGVVEAVIIPWRPPAPSAPSPTGSKNRPAPPVERYILTATGQDQPGIIKTISAAVSDRGGSFADLHCREDDGRFTLVSEVGLPDGTPVDQMQIDLEYAGRAFGLQVRLQHQRLFIATSEVAYRRFGL